MTIRKVKIGLPSLNPPVEKELRSGVVYTILCPRCYVGQTVCHLKARIADHRSRGPVKEHFHKCDSDISFDCIEMLASTNQGENTLLTVE